MATLYYVIYTSEKGDPSAAQIKAGQDASGSPASASGNETANGSAGAQYFSTPATGLTAATSYKVAFVWSDGTEDSNISVSGAWETTDGIVALSGQAEAVADAGGKLKVLPEGVFALDAFDQPDNTNLAAADSNWFKTALNGLYNLGVKDEKLYPPTTGSVALHVNTAIPPSADYSVSLDITTGASGMGNSSFYVAGRYDGYSDYYLAGYDSPSGNIQLFRNTLYGSLNIGTYPFSPASKQTFNVRLEMIGDAISAYLDGVLVIAVTDSVISSAGIAGVTGYTKTLGEWTADNFKAEVAGSAGVALTGDAQAAASASGDISVSVLLAGSAVGGASASGALYTEGSVALTATATATATASGDLSLSIPLSGSAVAQAMAQAGITQGVSLSGDASTRTYSRPVSDIATPGNFASSDGGPLYAAVDNVAVDDSRYIYNTSNAFDWTKIGIAPITAPATSKGHTLKYRAWNNGTTAYLFIYFWSGATLIVADIREITNTTPLDYEFPVAEQFAAKITDYSDLRFEVLVTAGTVNVSSLALEVDPVQAAGGLSHGIPLAGAAAAQALASASLTNDVPLMGAAITTASASASLGTVGDIQLTGAASATATADAVLSVGKELSGQATAQAVSVGGLLVGITLSGGATSQAGATAELSNVIQLSGAASGSSTASGSVLVSVLLQGSAVGSASATASLDALPVVGLSGAAVASATATGSLSKEIKLSGAALSVSSASSNITQMIPLTANAVAVSVATGGLGVAISLSASAIAEAMASAGLVVDKLLVGSAKAEGSATGNLSLHIRLTGEAYAEASSSGVLSIVENLTSPTVGWVISNSPRSWRIESVEARSWKTATTGRKWRVVS